jgi:hypothetical protein
VIGIASLLVVVLLSLLITRIATVAFVATGLSKTAARFQARSAFTGTGFTTGEAESVVNHPVRRRIVLVLMLLGNAGLAAVVASLMIGFTRSDRFHAWQRIVELLGGMLVLYAVSRSRWVDRWLTALIGRALRRWTDIETRDYASLLDLGAGYAVLELAVRDGDWLAGRTLRELALRDEGVAVLGVQHADGSYRGAPAGPTRIVTGDTLIVYGRQDDLCEIDCRPAGPEGDAAHERAVAEQERLEAKTASAA